MGPQSEHAIDVGEARLTSERTKDHRTLDEFLVLYLRDISSGKRSLRSARSKTTMFRSQRLRFGQLKTFAAPRSQYFAILRLQIVSGETVRQDLVLRGQVIEYARKECGVTLRGNPCADVKKPLSSQPRTRRISQDELKKLVIGLSGCKDPEIARVTWFSLATGMRRGEVLGLK